ncbi:MAG: single-stranded-DNA-specific exonuclease RecJ [Cytophagales bacterium]
MRSYPEKKWGYLPTPTAAARSALGQALGTSQPITTLLLQRGIRNFEEAKHFFRPQLAALHAPEKMKGMALAIKRIEQAWHEDEKVCVYGDYDVDGVTSVTMMVLALRNMGFSDVIYYLPDRYKEGYGLSTIGIEHLIASGVQLLVTVDCGIRDCQPIAQAQGAGIDVIVCDHHEPAAQLPPAYAILNPKQRDCPYPFKGLSGCGVAFKLLQGLVVAGLLKEETAMGFLDLVALSIAADIVPMVGENRILATYGLQTLNQNPQRGLQALKSAVQAPTKLTIADVVFKLAPCLNAPGRLSHARKGVQLLLAKTDTIATHWAQQLVAENSARRVRDTEMREEALAMIATQDSPETKRPCYLLFNPDWDKGLVGITAARCVEQYHRPTIVLTQQGDFAVGSARSIPGCNIFEALQQCEKLLLHYGGHAHAAGMTLPLAHVDTLRTQLEKIVDAMLPPEKRQPQQRIDTTLHLHQITTNLYKALQRMRPFGPGHMEPVFCTGPVIATSHRLYQEQHLSLSIQEVGRPTTWRAIGFNMAHLMPHVLNQQPFEIAYKLQTDCYRGETYYNLMLKDIRPYPTK